MTQYDAGPGDWSDREWEAPDHKPKPQARRRLVLPPWALIALLVAFVILLCVGLVLVVRAIRGGSVVATPTPRATFTPLAIPTATAELIAPPSEVAPTATVVLPTEATPVPLPAEIGVGTTVVVQGTGAAQLRVRPQPGISGTTLAFVKDGTELLVIGGPQSADGITWWQIRTADGKEGWVAGTYLALKP